MRIPDGLLDQWYRLVMEQDGAPDGDPLEAKLALARFIVTRSHGEEAAREAEAHFTRVVREGQAPEEVPELPLPDGDPVHLPAVLAAAFGLSDERGPPPDRRRGGQGRRRGRTSSSTWRARVSKMRLFRPGSAASSA